MNRNHGKESVAKGAGLRKVNDVDVNAESGTMAKVSRRRLSKKKMKKRKKNFNFPFFLF